VGAPTTPAAGALTGFSLPGGPQTAAEARERVAADERVAGPIGNVLLLLLTELVTNAVRHGGANEGKPVEVGLALSTEGAMVAVTDPGRGFDWRGRAEGRPRDGGGYGLVLVDRMARRWGIQRDEDSTTVWFELAPR
jgi:anti-sigma regulatory factor (Ser/Thr protein kinase)